MGLNGAVGKLNDEGKSFPHGEPGSRWATKKKSKPRKKRSKK